MGALFICKSRQVIIHLTNIILTNNLYYNFLGSIMSMKNGDHRMKVMR